MVAAIAVLDKPLVCSVQGHCDPYCFNDRFVLLILERGKNKCNTFTMPLTRSALHSTCTKVYPFCRPRDPYLLFVYWYQFLHLLYRSREHTGFQVCAIGVGYVDRPTLWQFDLSNMFGKFEWRNRFLLNCYRINSYLLYKQTLVSAGNRPWSKSYQCHNRDMKLRDKTIKMLTAL